MPPLSTRSKRALSVVSDKPSSAKRNKQATKAPDLSQAAILSNSDTSSNAGDSDHEGQQYTPDATEHGPAQGGRGVTNALSVVKSAINDVEKTLQQETATGDSTGPGDNANELSVIYTPKEIAVNPEVEEPFVVNATGTAEAINKVSETVKIIDTPKESAVNADLFVKPYETKPMEAVPEEQTMLIDAPISPKQIGDFSDATKDVQSHTASHSAFDEKNLAVAPVAATRYNDSSNGIEPADNTQSTNRGFVPPNVLLVQQPDGPGAPSTQAPVEAAVGAQSVVPPPVLLVQHPDAAQSTINKTQSPVEARVATVDATQSPVKTTVGPPTSPNASEVKSVPPQAVPRYAIRAVEPEEEVMQADLQDELLQDTYKGLYPLNPAAIQTFSNNPDPRSFVYYSEWEYLAENPKQAMSLIKEAITFEHLGPYFNLSRANPELLSFVDQNDAGVDFLKIHAGRSDEIVVCCSTGMVFNCDLVNGKASGPNAPRPFRIKKMYFLLHAQEFQRFISANGTIFDFSRTTGDFYNNMIGLQTARHYNDSQRRGARNTTAMRLDEKRKNARGNKPTGRTPGTAAASFRAVQTQLAYAESVPIYDARKVENFSMRTHAQAIHDLPLYKNGQADLPDGSAAVAGFTIGRAIATGGLYFNIQWVILLALPTDE